MNKKSEIIGNGSEELSGFTPEQLLAVMSHFTLIKAFSKDQKGISTEVQESAESQKIILPKGMSLLDASKELKNMHTNLEQEINVDALFEGHDWQDVLYAVKNVSEQEFGWINGVITENWRGDIERPSEIDILIDVKDGKEITEKCFYGKFRVGAWENAEVDVSVTRSGAVKVNVVAKKKFSKTISEYFQDIRTFIANNSIFRGKTVVVTSKTKVFDTGIHFKIIENKASDPIILNRKEQVHLDKFILPTLNMPGKKSYLFIGEYGNGKTATAMSIGRQANSNATPFFYVKDAALLDRVLVLADKYEPCVIFLEDLDEVASGNERDERINRIINTIDGIETKGRNITVMFTTNHHERINPAMRRPGRLDQVLEFYNPEIATKISILKTYLKDITGSEDIDYNRIATLAGDVNGATVAEMAKRAVSIAKINGYINTEDVEDAVLSMGAQIKFMQGTADMPSKTEQFADIFCDLIMAKVKGELSEIKKAIAEL
jgi:AAA+ superfamily predicted ATPase